MVSFLTFRAPIKPGCLRARLQKNTARGLDQRAGKRGNQGEWSRRIRLGMVGLGLSKHMPDVLNHGVLESAARSKKRKFFFSRKPNGIQGPLHISVRTGRNAP